MTAELTPTEARVLAAYRGMDAQHKDVHLTYMERVAVMFPNRPPPRLRLVASNSPPAPRKRI